MRHDPRLENVIRVYRAKHQMSQQELADRIGVRRETISHLEKGKYNPSLLLVMNIAEVFHVRMDDLFTVETVQAANSSNIE